MSLLRIPHLYRLIPARSGQAFAIGAEADTADKRGMPLECQELFPILRVPDSNRFIQAGASDSFAVGTVADTRGPTAMGSLNGEKFLPLFRVPHLDLRGRQLAS